MAEREKISLSKEAIASNMFRNAAIQWGLPDTNLDNFDPLVRLLIEACAIEMYRISNQVETVQERMIEKLAGLLTPQVYVLPKPAHGILHARGIEPEGILPVTTQFFHQKKIASKPNGPLDTNLELFFSPAGTFKAIDGDIKIIAAGNNVYSINDNYAYKEGLVRTSGALPQRTVWAGLELSADVTTLAGVSLFFELKNTPDKDKYFSLIPYTQCAVNDTPVAFETGIYQPARQGYEFQDTLEELYINNRIEHQARLNYKDRYITFSGDNSFLQLGAHKLTRQKYPVVFEEVMNAQDLAKFTKELVWIKLTFRPEFTADVLDDMTVAINCFPVVNRHMNEITYRLQSFFNIIPLQSAEQFLAVSKVETTVASTGGDKGNEYQFYAFDQFEMAPKGTYTVRTGELERFSNRNATEYMNYLVELLRDESRAFAAIGQDFIATLIKSLNQSIAQIEQKLKQSAGLMNNNPAYLLINPIEENDTIFAHYWTSNGEMGNNVRSGSKMELYEGAQLKKESIVLMTTTTGGSNKLKNTETLNAYKNVLVSRGRVVTQQDILGFCTYFLTGKANIKSINIEKGVGISAKPLEGLIPTVDINIKPYRKDELTTEEWDAVKHELLVNLEDQSAVNLNYRVFVN